MHVCCELCLYDLFVSFWHERRIRFEFQACRGSMGPFTICVRISSLPVIIPPVGLYPCKIIKDYIILGMFLWRINHIYFDTTSNMCVFFVRTSHHLWVLFLSLWCESSQSHVLILEEVCQSALVYFRSPSVVVPFLLRDSYDNELSKHQPWNTD